MGSRGFAEQRRRLRGLRPGQRSGPRSQPAHGAADAAERVAVCFCIERWVYDTLVAVGAIEGKAAEDLIEEAVRELAKSAAVHCRRRGEDVR